MELIQDLIVIYIVTMFGTNWSTFVDARVKTVRFSNFCKFKGK